MYMNVTCSNLYKLSFRNTYVDELSNPFGSFTSDGLNMTVAVNLINSKLLSNVLDSSHFTVNTSFDYSVNVNFIVVPSISNSNLFYDSSFPL